MKTLSAIAIFFLFALSGTVALAEDELYFIDAHSQASHDIALEEILRRMDQAGVRRTILSARARRKSREIAEFAAAQPDRIIAAVRVKSRHYKRNKPKYYKKLRKQVNTGDYNAMAEVLLYHAQKGERAEEVVVYPDDQRVSAALDAAIDNGWPFIAHVEFAALSGEQRKLFLQKFTTLLEANPGHPFALIHMGQLDSSAVKKLIEQYSNLYFLTSHSNPVSTVRSRQPWINMFTGGDFTPAWKSLMIKYPDRFVFAVDNVWPEHWLNGYHEQVELWRNALHKLPADAAHKIAHGNAERLWRIK